MIEHQLNSIIEESPFEFIAGHLCLDFINTDIIQDSQRVNLLPDFSYFVAWLVQAQKLNVNEGQRVLNMWGNVEYGKQLLARGLAIRSMMRGMVEAITHQETIAAPTIAAINELLQYQWGYLKLLQKDDRFVLEFRPLIEQPFQLLVPIAEAAADLLTNTDFSLIKRCNNPLCVRYFYDTTRNHSRRWCSMETCGNRIKVAAYYARKNHSGT